MDLTSRTLGYITIGVGIAALLASGDSYDGDPADELVGDIFEGIVWPEDPPSLSPGERSPLIVNGSLRLLYPLPNAYRIGSDFGLRTIRGKQSSHSGVDIGAPIGTAVYAAADGKVARSHEAGSCGGGVILAHQYSPRISSTYCHLSRMLVSVGDTVKQGQVIGEVGWTGNVIPKAPSASHLHFALHMNGSYVDPKPYFFGGPVPLKK